MDSESTTIRVLLNQGEAFLVEAGVPNARRNTEWILLHLLDYNSLDLYTRSGWAPSPVQIRDFWGKIERRAGREPLQYILQSTEFMSLPFEIPPGVFVPRPDTELLVEVAEKLLKRQKPGGSERVLDLCCGSGIIGVALAVRDPAVAVVAVDSDELAVRIANRNAAKNGVIRRVQVVHLTSAQYLAPAAPGPGREYDLFQAVLCNPPYIVTSLLPELTPEVRDHEPREALDGGADGLDHYREVIPLLAPRLQPGGFVAFEVGDAQSAAVVGLLKSNNFIGVSVFKDYAGLDRVVMGQRRNSP